MAKESKNNIFTSELKGFKKKQVIEYISDLENTHREKIEAYEKEKASMQAEIDSLNAQYAELKEKYSELQSEKAQVASVLINAENTAAKIVDAARKEGESEKQRLYDESEDLRRTIVKRNGIIQDVKVRAENIFDALLDDVRDAVSSLEEYIAQGRAQFTDDVAQVDAFVTAYDNYADSIGNEFDLDDEGSEEDNAEKDPAEEFLPTGEGDEEEDIDFSKIQAEDDGVENTDYDENFKKMGLAARNDAEVVPFFGDAEE